MGQRINGNIMDLCDLRNQLSQKYLLDCTNINKKFETIAEFLIKHVAIQKGDKEYG
jgi:hypothetical protein